jgi:hypothetical protein
MQLCALSVALRALPYKQTNFILLKICYSQFCVSFVIVLQPYLIEWCWYNMFFTILW